MTDEEREIAIKANEKFKAFIDEYSKDPENEKYKTGIFYKTPDGSIIEAAFEDEYSVFGVIVESPIKAQVGLKNNFLHRELKKHETFKN
jgi:hypothetical protein